MVFAHCSLPDYLYLWYLLVTTWQVPPSISNVIILKPKVRYSDCCLGIMNHLFIICLANIIVCYAKFCITYLPFTYLCNPTLETTKERECNFCSNIYFMQSKFVGKKVWIILEKKLEYVLNVLNFLDFHLPSPVF